MTLTNILGQLRGDAERMLHRFDRGESKLYEMLPDGSLVEWTDDFRRHHEGLVQALDRALVLAQARG